MLRVIGAGLLLTASSTLGFSAASELRAHVRELEQFIASFELMERELNGRLTPLPELLRLVCGSTKDDVKSFYLLCSSSWERKRDRPFSALWRASLAAAQLRLRDEELLIIESLGEVLGRYDGESQCRAVRETVEKLKESLADAKERQARLGRVYGALGMTAGAFLIIILI